MPQPLVGIMAKAPRPGHAKTRLTAALPPEVAADLYLHFLHDTIEVVRRVPSVTPVLVCPPGDAAALHTCELGLPIWEQPTPGLMQGLVFGVSEALALGHPAVALINADSPTLPPERIAMAFSLLTNAEVVLGPSADGGYYLIGARVSCIELLCGAPYPSSETICADTLARAHALGIKADTIDPWFDVDLPAELHQMAQSLHEEPAHVAIHTRRALATHAALIANMLT